MASDRPSSEVADVLDVDGVGVGVGGLGGGQQEAEPGSTVLSSENFSQVWFFIFVIKFQLFLFSHFCRLYARVFFGSSRSRIPTLVSILLPFIHQSYIKC